MFRILLFLLCHKVDRQGHKTLTGGKLSHECLCSHHNNTALIKQISLFDTALVIKCDGYRCHLYLFVQKNPDPTLYKTRSGLENLQCLYIAFQKTLILPRTIIIQIQLHNYKVASWLSYIRYSTLKFKTINVKICIYIKIYLTRQKHFN